MAKKLIIKGANFSYNAIKHDDTENLVKSVTVGFWHFGTGWMKPLALLLSVMLTTTITQIKL